VGSQPACLRRCTSTRVWVASADVRHSITAQCALASRAAVEPVGYVAVFVAARQRCDESGQLHCERRSRHWLQVVSRRCLRRMLPHMSFPAAQQTAVSAALARTC
jgi:hypothetical protein